MNHRFACIAALLALTVPSAALAEEAKEEAKTEAKEGESKTAAPTATTMAKNQHDMLSKGSVILGAERVFGFSSSVEKIGDAQTRYTQVGILWANPRSVYQFARMGIDYIAIDNVTIGGSLGIAHTSAKVGDNTAGSTNLLVAPRVGYLFGGTGVLSFWARLGPSFWSVSGGDTSAWGFAVNVEPAIIISPYAHVGIYLGGVLDLGLAGKMKVKDASQDYKVTNYGINSGLIAWF